MKLNSQHYSKIARDYIYKLRETENPYITGVTYGDLNIMEELAILFGWDDNKNKQYIEKYNIGTDYGWGRLHSARFKFVLDRLDRESKRPDALFNKYYINYPGIINKPTRCFFLKEFDE